MPVYVSVCFSWSWAARTRTLHILLDEVNDLMADYDDDYVYNKWVNEFNIEL